MDNDGDFDDDDDPTRRYLDDVGGKLCRPKVAEAKVYEAACDQAHRETAARVGVVRGRDR